MIGGSPTAPEIAAELAEGDRGHGDPPRRGQLAAGDQLLDEVAAHLDAERRAALFDEIDALSLQAFLTGTDKAIFEAIRGRALGVRVEASSLTVAER